MDIMRIADAAAQEYMAIPQVVGLSLGIAQAGEASFIHYGEVVRGSHQLPTNDTIYLIASITKTFTGTLLAQAVVEQRIGLDDDVRSYLDDRHIGLAYHDHPIRIKHLLNHRSGLPFFLPDVPEAIPGYQQEVIPWSARAAKLLAEYPRERFLTDLGLVQLDMIPGTDFRYSNAAAQLVGYILEDVYGNSYEALLERYIRIPLTASTLKISLTQDEQLRLAQGYDEHGRLMPIIPDQLQAAGAMKATIPDLLAYMQWHMTEHDEAIRLSHQPTWQDGHTYASGLSWQMLTSDYGYRTIWQDGAVPGFYSLCVFCPEAKVGVVLLSNELDQGTSQRATAVANQLLQACSPLLIPLP
jgi:serine-type D-Ala-D-Ala carboxypeptidase/endopeptidase